MCAVISIKYNSWYKLAEIVGILAMGIHTWMRIFYFCSAGQQVNLEKPNIFIHLSAGARF